MVSCGDGYFILVEVEGYGILRWNSLIFIFLLYRDDFSVDIEIFIVCLVCLVGLYFKG